ncbi:MAG: hypothetical protein AABX11_04625 [Nanoarchaeota archaeon]
MKKEFIIGIAIVIVALVLVFSFFPGKIPNFNPGVSGSGGKMCGSSPYDQSTQGCCNNNEIYLLDNKICCNRGARDVPSGTDPDDALCCEYRYWGLKSNAYDPTKSICCSAGGVGSIPAGGTSANTSCCGIDRQDNAGTYDTATQFCCIKGAGSLTRGQEIRNKPAGVTNAACCRMTTTQIIANTYTDYDTDVNKCCRADYISGEFIPGKIIPKSDSC